MECPYCKNEMCPGNIEADGRSNLIWVDSTHKRSIFSKLKGTDCIILDQTDLFTRCKVSAYHCDKCKKIIIDTTYSLIR